MTTAISAQEGDVLSSAMVGVVAQGNIQSTFTVTVSTSDGTAVGKCRIYYLCIVTTVSGYETKGRHAVAMSTNLYTMDCKPCLVSVFTHGHYLALICHAWWQGDI